MFKKFFLSIFVILIVCLIFSSFFPQELAHKYFYETFWFKILWAILATGLFIDLVNLLKKKNLNFALIYGGFLFILLGGFLTSFLEEEGFMELKEGQTANVFWINDNLSKPLDFSIYLKDFSLEFYPEKRKDMRFVKSYKSSVAISKEDSLLKEAIIEVNRPLKFSGYNFYQYGYDPKIPEQTVLQVVKDPGLPFVYAGYIILLIGMFLSFKRAWKII